jgi:hypothetical protein
MLRKNVGMPPVLIIQFITEYIIEFTLLLLSLCLLFNIICGLNMMQMNRQWMNADRRSPEYIAGMQAFLEESGQSQQEPKGIHVLSMLFVQKRKRLL